MPKRHSRISGYAFLPPFVNQPITERPRSGSGSQIRRRNVPRSRENSSTNLVPRALARRHLPVVVTFVAMPFCHTYLFQQKSRSPTTDFLFMYLLSKHKPEIKVCGNNRSECERNADAEEVLVLDLIAVLSENTDTRDISRCTDGCAVATESCA